jgi:integrase
MAEPLQLYFDYGSTSHTQAVQDALSGLVQLARHGARPVEILSKLRNLRNLKIDLSALYLIAEQRTPDAVRDELIQRAESGEKITRRVALKAIEQFKAPAEPTRKPIQPETRGRKRKPVSLIEVQQVIEEFPKDRQAGGAPNLHQSTATSEKQAVPEPTPKPIKRETSIESNLVELDQKRQELSGSAMAANTLSSYRHGWKLFTAWCAEVTRCALPASADTVSLFLTAQLTKGLKVASAKQRLAAIIYYHQLDGIELPGRFAAAQLLRSAQRQRGERPSRSRPLQIDELRQISDLLIKNGSARSIRDRAVLLVGFASALRRSSIAALTLDDLEFTSEGVILTIVREKQDQEAKGRYVAIPHGKHENTCAVRALRNWLAIRPECSTRAVFLRLTKGHEHSALYPELIAHVVKCGAVLIGLDPSVFSGHSLRSGLITAGGEAGLSDLLIAEQSGHRNMNVLRTYMRRPKAFRSNACAALDI